MQYWQLVKWGSNNFSLLIPITTITTNITITNNAATNTINNITM